MTALDEHAAKFADLPLLTGPALPTPADHPDINDTILDEWVSPSGRVTITLTRHRAGRTYPFEVQVITPQSWPVVLRYMRHCDHHSAAVCFEQHVADYEMAGL